MQTVETFGQYGQKQRGFRSSQFVHDMVEDRWYCVEYVVENLDDVLGNYEVTQVREVRDVWGMGTVSFESVTPGEHVTAKRLFDLEMVKMIQRVLG